MQLQQPQELLKQQHLQSQNDCDVLFVTCSIDRHEEQLRTMFRATGPVDTLKSRVSAFLQEKRAELRSTNSNVQKMKQQLSSKQAEKRMTL